MKELARRQTQLPAVTFESTLIYAEPLQVTVPVKVIRWGVHVQRVGEGATELL